MRLPILSLFVFAGCAAGFQTVPESRYQIVPGAQRDAIEGRYQTDLAAAQAEEKAARSASIVAERGLERRAVPHSAPAVARPPDTSDPQWAAELRKKEQLRADGRIRIERTDRAARRAILAWRQ